MNQKMHGDLFPARRSIGHGFVLATSLGLALLVLTAWQSVATLVLRLGTTEVMRAAGESLLTGAMGNQVTHFAVAQITLHAAFGAIAWVMAITSIWLWRRTSSQFLGLVVLWYCLLTIAVLAYNATWFPRTGSGEYYHALATTKLGPYSAGQVVSSGVLVLLGIVLAAAAMRLVTSLFAAAYGKVLTVVAAVLLATSALIAGAAIRPNASSSHFGDDRPNVILIGIDSLRLEQLRRFGGTGVTPNLDSFLTNADIVSDATTPVARTFPSWLAILTGRSPRKTGAIFNLMKRDEIDATPTLADILRATGYRTVYATDEVRFAPIDESYGFDQVVTPPIGAADFLLGNFNDLPLPTVVANSRIGRMLFPYSHGNRGAAIVFQPATFLNRVDREIDFNGPTMLALHLTAAHYPYFIATTPPDDEMRPAHDQDRPLYMSGLKAADEMFGHVVQALERKGALKNAIVVVLSDHGEALGLRGDSLIDAEQMHVNGALMPPSILAFGHGQSVLSPVQYQVLMSFRAFGPTAGFKSSQRTLRVPATVEDIAPTVLDLLKVDSTSMVANGRSLAGVLRGDDSATSQFTSRFRYTETDLRVMGDMGGNVDEDETAKQNSVYFEVDAPTGRLQMRSEAVHLLMNFKERAVFDEITILACLPATPDTHQYLLLDRKSGAGRVLVDIPSPDDLEASRLWDALQQGFPGELKPPTTLRPEDVQATRRAWNEFLTSHLTASVASSAKSAQSASR